MLESQQKMLSIYWFSGVATLKKLAWFYFLFRGLCTKYVRSREILIVYLVIANSLPGSLTEKECLVTPRRSDQPLSVRLQDERTTVGH